MKTDDIVLQFRRAYHKLGYVKNKLTVGFLDEWTTEWCVENGIVGSDISFFIVLGQAYATKELYEHDVRLWYKRKK